MVPHLLGKMNTEAEHTNSVQTVQDRAIPKNSSNTIYFFRFLTRYNTDDSCRKATLKSTVYEGYYGHSSAGGTLLTQYVFRLR